MSLYFELGYCEPIEIMSNPLTVELMLFHTVILKRKVIRLWLLTDLDRDTFSFVALLTRTLVERH